MAIAFRLFIRQTRMLAFHWGRFGGWFKRRLPELGVGNPNRMGI